MKLSEETRAFAAALIHRLHVTSMHHAHPIAHTLNAVANCIAETVKVMNAAEAVDEAVRAGADGK